MSDTTDFEAIFADLRAAYAKYEKKCVVIADEAGKYYLATHEVRAKDGYRTWLGGVEIRKGYVSAHLIPVYAHPDMLEDVSDALCKRMQGKSCFNFKKPDAALQKELKSLIDAGVKRFQADGRL